MTFCSVSARKLWPASFRYRPSSVYFWIAAWAVKLAVDAVYMPLAAWRLKRLHCLAWYPLLAIPQLAVGVYAALGGHFGWYRWKARAEVFGNEAKD